MKMTLLARLLILSLLIAACAPLTPGRGDGSEPGQVFISKTDLLIMESYPVQVLLSVSGELPTPCHQLFTEVKQSDEMKRIDVTVESQAGNEEACIQVLEPFSVQLPIDMLGATDGVYSVWVNGERVGEFTYPG